MSVAIDGLHVMRGNNHNEFIDKQIQAKLLGYNISGMMRVRTHAPI